MISFQEWARRNRGMMPIADALVIVRLRTRGAWSAAHGRAAESAQAAHYRMRGGSASSEACCPPAGPGFANGWRLRPVVYQAHAGRGNGMTKRTKVVLLDIDGTLIDSNDQHAQAWVDVGREFGIDIDYDHVRRLIGMGGDKVLPEVAGVEEDDPLGKKIKERRGDLFRERYLPKLKPFPHARELLERLREDGYTLVVATSASKEDMDGLLKQAGIRDLIEEKTSSSDAEESKPDPDIVQAALGAADARPEQALMLGDTPYDVEASGRAGVRCVALRCGGWGDADLADAVAVYDDPSDLLARYAESPFAAE
jgi:HAD superfamily hydrolase (TIGR01509 family)